MWAKITNILLILLTFSGCQIINPEEKLPVYIQVDEFELNTDFGQPTHNITDVWLSTAESDRGIWELPNIIPVLEEGEVIIDFAPGIYKNGINSDRNKYFFYKAFRDTINVASGQTISINPKTEYIESAVFSIEGSEDFENVISLMEVNNGDFVYESGELADNNQVATISANQNNTAFEFVPKEDFLINNDKINAPVFIEFDYKSNTEIEYGMYITFEGFTQERPFVTFYSTEGEWRHVYIELTGEVNLSGRETLYRSYFKSGSEVSVGDYISLDNIKIVYQE